MIFILNWKFKNIEYFNVWTILSVHTCPTVILNNPCPPSSSNFVEIAHPPNELGTTFLENQPGHIEIFEYEQNIQEMDTTGILNYLSLPSPSLQEIDQSSYNELCGNAPKIFQGK